MKTSKKQREQENKILAQNALKSYKKLYLESNELAMENVYFPYDERLYKNHIEEILNRFTLNDTVIRLREIVNNN